MGDVTLFRVLIVDDESKIREVIREYAELEGFFVHEAGDGMEALELCKKNDYDIIIMDIMMPNTQNKGHSHCNALCPW